MTSTDAVEPISRREQREFEKLVSLGASPAGACQKMGITLDAVWVALERDGRFRKRIERIRESLDENVKAALYRAALEGSVSAQTFWLRTAEKKLSEEEHPLEATLSALSEEELLRRARGAAERLISDE